MPDSGCGFPLAASLDENSDRHALADVEDVLVGAAVGRSLLLEGVAVQRTDNVADHGLGRVANPSPLAFGSKNPVRTPGAVCS